MHDLKQLRASVAVSGTSGPERLLLARILSSGTFHRCARLRDLLADIIQHTLAGKSALLGEHSLGVRLFDRAEDYNPSDDNIVRASVRQLRIKLKEYFDTEGAAETLIIEIPKGGYTAVFRPRDPRASAAASPLPPQRRWPWVVLAVAAVFFIVAVALWLDVRRAMPGETPTVFSELFRMHPGPVDFVLTDSALVLQSPMRGGPPSLDEYASRSYINQFTREPRSPETLRYWGSLSDRQITSLADVGILTRLLQIHPAPARRLVIRHAKHMSARDFKTGNFILTGSWHSNPWARLFEPQLHFQVSSPPGRFVNLRPFEGELTYYTDNWMKQRLPSRVAVVPNLTGTGFVLLAAGISMESTEGAGEFLHRPDSLPAIRKALRLQRGEALPYFEILLETTATRGTARSSRILAARRH